MDLRRMKTVFILVLAAINVMLLCFLSSARNYEKKEKQIMVKNVSALLAQNMIYLPEAVQVPDSPDIYNFYLEKMFGSNRDMIVKFLGEEYTEEPSGTYKSNRGTLTIEGDEFKLYKTKPTGTVSDFSRENIEKLCRNEMKAFGMMPEAYEFNGFNLVDDGTRAIFTVKKDKSEFFDAYISFDISGMGIYAISGRNIISGMSVSGGTSPYVNVVSILADLVKCDRLEKNTAHTIVSIKPGYYIGKTAESYLNILAIPVWQIATDRGMILHYDARNGREIIE